MQLTPEQKSALTYAIKKKLNRMAEDAFDLDAEDSDGLDQAERQGIEIAMDAVLDIIKRW